MKKSVSVVLMLSLVSAMLFGLTACGSKEETPIDENPVVETPEVETPDVETPDVETPEVETPEVEEPIDEVAGYEELNQKGIDALDAMFAEGSDTSAITAQSIVDKMKEVYGETYLPSMVVESTVFNDMTGLTSEDYVEFVGETPMISTHVDSIYVVKAAEGKAETVKTALESYRASQIEGAMQYPMNVPKWEASKVVTYGDFVVFIMLGGYIEEPIADGDVVGDPTVDGTMPTDGDAVVSDDTTVTDDTAVSDVETSTDDTYATDGTISDDTTVVDVTETDSSSDFS